MKCNKGGLWGTITQVAFVLLLVAVVAFIVFKSFGISTSTIFGIFEPYKKMFGFDDETPKQSQEPATAEQSQKPSECTIKRFYWSTEKINIGDQADIFIEGSSNCNDKKVYISLFSDKSLWADEHIETITGTFDENKIDIKWTVKQPSVAQYRFNGYYFKVKIGNIESQESRRLEIE